MTQLDSHLVVTPSGRKRPVSIPWREIACRLAEGAKPAAIAAGLGLPEERIWRHLRNSLRFRHYLKQAVERQRLLSGLQLAALGQRALLARGLTPESLDGDLLRLLNEAAHPREEPACDVGQRIEQLGKTGARPPNMAFRRRLAEEKRRMDQQVEIWRIQDTLRAAAQAAVAPPVVPPAAHRAGEPARRDTSTSEAERSATNAGEAARSQTYTGEAARSQTNAGEHARRAANNSEPLRTGATDRDAEPKLRLRWSRPPKPRHPPAQVLLATPGAAPDS
jgi:hypothetical protein